MYTGPHMYCTELGTLICGRYENLQTKAAILRHHSVGLCACLGLRDKDALVYWGEEETTCFTDGRVDSEDCQRCKAATKALERTKSANLHRSCQILAGGCAILYVRVGGGL